MEENRWRGETCVRFSTSAQGQDNVSEQFSACHTRDLFGGNRCLKSLAVSCRRRECLLCKSVLPQTFNLLFSFSRKKKPLLENRKQEIFNPFIQPITHKYSNVLTGSPSCFFEKSGFWNKTKPVDRVPSVRAISVLSRSTSWNVTSVLDWTGLCAYGSCVAYRQENRK